MDATSSILSAKDVARIVRTAVKDASRDDLEDRARYAASIQLERKPSLRRALAAAVRGEWSQAGFERDLSAAAAKAFGYEALSPHAFVLPTTAAELAVVYETLGERLPQAAVKALAEGTPSQTTGYQGIATLTGLFAAPLVAPTVLRAMPEVTTVPVTAATLEFPRTAAGTVQLPGENNTISATDLVPALREVLVKKPSLLQIVSSEVYADVGDPGAEILFQRALSKALLSFLDGQELAGSGSGTNVLGIRNMSGLTTSSWTAPTNGGTPSGDQLASMVQDIFTANAYPTAMVMNPRTAFTIARLKDSTGKYQFPDFMNAPLPADDYSAPRRAGHLWGTAVYISTNVPINETQGSASTATTILYGDFSYVYLLSRQGVELFASPHQNLNADQVVIRATVREAVAVAQPLALSVASGIV